MSTDSRSPMPDLKLRRLIVYEAARLMYYRHETEYYRAKMKAARKICQGWVKPSDLPANWEIRDEIQLLAQMLEGTDRSIKLREMRLLALQVLRWLKPWKPRLIGSTLTGHIRQGSDIDIHVFCSGTEPITGVLDHEGLTYDVEFKRITKHNEERVFTHIHVQEVFPIELTVYPTSKSNYVFKSSITGKPMERASLAEFERFLEREYPDLDLDSALDAVTERVDRFTVYRSLLAPLAGIEQSRRHHPEGDVLYHSLQVFELACDHLAYDEEFLLAALLHDVGKGIDASDHVQAGLDALADSITPRTAWLIEHHMQAHAFREGTLGHKASRRIQASEDYEELLTLSRCDQAGRVPGAQVRELDDALDYIRELARMYG